MLCVIVGGSAAVVHVTPTFAAGVVRVSVLRGAIRAARVIGGGEVTEAPRRGDKAEQSNDRLAHRSRNAAALTARLSLLRRR